MFKKIVAAVLAGMLICVSFAGCGSSKDDGSEQVNVTWVINQDKQADTDVVEKEINNKLAELLPNTTLEIVHSPKMFDKWSMWMAAKQSYDIAYQGFQCDMLSEVYKDSYIELDDLIDQYAPNIKKEMKEFPAEYESGRVDGKLYAIPNVQSIIHQVNYIGVDADQWSYFPVDELIAESRSNPKTTSKMYDIFEGFLDKLSAAGILKSGEYSVDVANFFLSVVCRGYDWVGTAKGGAWLCYDAYDPDAKIVSFMQTDAYKLWLEYAARWYDKGYISEDYIVSGAAGKMLLSGNVTESWVNLDDDRGIKYVPDTDGSVKQYNILLDGEDRLYQGTSIFGSAKTYEVIPFTAEHPERAMKLIDLLHSDKGTELLNLIVYGFEKNSDYAAKYGTWHYELKTSENDDKPIAYGNGYINQPDSKNLYGIAHWRVCNIFKCYRTPNILDGQEEWALDYLSNRRQDLPKTRYYNFKANLRDYSYKIAQINSALAEYHSALISGTLKSDWQGTYDAMMQKMEAGGLSGIIKAVQKQADDYVASK